MTSLQSAMANILSPVIRILIARGVRFPELSDWVKEIYLTVSERNFRLNEKKLTDSRVHLLTGLQRKDIKAIRARVTADTSLKSAGPISRIVGLWLAEHSETDGSPQPLNRLGPAPSFEEIVASVSRDMHLRTVQDELIRLGLAEVSGELISLTSAAYLPIEDDAALMGYLGASLGDHAAAAAENVLAAPEPGQHLERAVHYNRLSEVSLEELNALSRSLLSEALSQINKRAAELQQRDQDMDSANKRFRAGAFVYRAEEGKS